MGKIRKSKKYISLQEFATPLHIETSIDVVYHFSVNNFIVIRIFCICLILLMSANFKIEIKNCRELILTQNLA